MAMIYRYLFFLLTTLVSLQVEAQHFLEKSFNIIFPNGISNQVSYIQIPVNVKMWGSIEVQITGGYNSQLNRGVLTKRIDLVYNGKATEYLNQESEIIESSEPLASYWAIGEFDKENSWIPIYHLNNKGNEIGIKIRMHLVNPTAIAPLQAGITVSSPVEGAGGIGRSYRNFNDARIGIGTTSPEHKLDIVGTARAHSILVNTQKTADFVFEPDYRLPTLDSIKTFVQENKHLPGIPSAKQMEKDGINVGDLQIDLLQKIEELTLHVIELDRINKEQQRKIDALVNAIKNK